MTTTLEYTEDNKSYYKIPSEDLKCLDSAEKLWFLEIIVKLLAKNKDETSYKDGIEKARVMWEAD